MADENWQQIRKIFDGALRRKLEERRKFVHEACGDDKTLLTEVESLLSSLNSAESFMETPAVAEVADVIEAETKHLERGKCFGHYEIIEQMGAGGMGEVYLATDKKLERRVAVKILNEKFSRDESNLKRFIQEAKAASALNHPNILVIHEIGESEEAHHIVSEYIKGVTLRESFKKKTLKLSESLDISIQIANALCTAHEAHLVHRDIKPENIMIRPDGYVKILDFGLAKLVERKAVGFEESIVKQNQTAKGVILGTVNYMSPEQAKGERVDERTDIFSFGVVIYEMITGRTPFAGDSGSETFANLINAEPSLLSRFALNVPNELQTIVSKMLRKNADERYQTMRNVLTDLKDLLENLKSEQKLENLFRPEGNTTGKITVTTNREKQQTFLTDWNYTFAFKRHRKKIIIGVCAVLIFSIFSILSLNLHRFSKSENTIEPFRQMRLNRLTNIGNVGNFALSPDGNLIVYETKEKEGVSIWVRQIEMSNAVNLVPQKKGIVTFLTFSPNGKLVYYGFFSGFNSTAELYSVPALGGASRKIKADLATNFMSFAPDGRRYAQVDSNLKLSEKYLVINSLDNNEETRLAVRKTPRSFNITGQFCAWSPDGKTIAVISTDTDGGGHFSTLVGVNAADGSEKPLSAKRWNALDSVQWLKDGSGLLVLGSDAPQMPNQIWFVSAADGEARMLTNDLNGYSYVGVTADGKQIVAVQETRTSSVWLGTVGQNEHDFKELISETGTLDTIISAVNGNIVFRSNADGKSNLWTIGNDGGGRKQITVDAQVDGRGLCVAPDGKQIVYPSQKAGKVNLWRVDADGGDSKQLTFGDGEFYPDCLPDKREVIYQKGSGYGIKSMLWKISLDGGEPVQLTDYYAIRPAISPDGSRVAFFYIAKEKWSIGIVSSDGGAIEQNFEVPDGLLERLLRWSPDGQSLFYIANKGNVGNVWSLPLDSQLPKQVTKFDSQLLVNFVPAQSGKKSILTRTVKLSDMVILSEE
jgi:eukaryotic-like serine/threonine-protein kinase